MPQILSHLFMKKNPLALGLWNTWGYIQGVCWIFFGSAKCEMSKISSCISRFSWAYEHGMNTGPDPRSFRPRSLQLAKITNPIQLKHHGSSSISTWPLGKQFVWISMGNKGCPNWMNRTTFLHHTILHDTHTIHVHSDAAMSDSGSDILSMPWPFGTMVNMHSRFIFLAQRRCLLWQLAGRLSSSQAAFWLPLRSVESSPWQAESLNPSCQSIEFGSNSL